jgi:hypothetical protein
MLTTRPSSCDVWAIDSAAMAAGGRSFISRAISSRCDAYTEGMVPWAMIASSHACSRSTSSRRAAIQASGLNQCSAQAALASILTSQSRRRTCTSS